MNAQLSRQALAKYWSPDEMAILRREYPNGGSRAVHALLPHRSKKSIVCTASREDVVCTKSHNQHVQPSGSKRKDDFAGIPVAIPNDEPADAAVRAWGRGSYEITPFGYALLGAAA